MLCSLSAGIVSAAAASQPAEKIVQAIDVAPVWSGHPVGFALLTHHTNQFVAFYDDQRRMTVAARPLNSTEWRFARLPQTLGWDSHNYVTLAIDATGRLHLSGNMHVRPLVYFRTRQPLDIESFAALPAMIGNREKRCTYPAFLRGPKDELIFTYRDGSSGNGDQLYNVYDEHTQTWKRLLDQPLTSGEGLMNAYFMGPVRGPDGFFHLCWVWRDTGDCASNHDPCYARSRDLTHWEKSNGQPLTLPITLKSAEVVDPVPAGGGVINGNTRLGFDTQRRPILSYHKFDAAGKTQLYNARLENGRWKIYQTSDWDYRWEFHGGGSIGFEIRIGPVQVDAAGQITQSFSHKHHGSGVWVLDEATLKPRQLLKPASPFAHAPAVPASGIKGLQTRSAGDLGASDEPGVHYVLRWETLPSNRDQPRPGPLPPPTLLRLYKLVTAPPSARGF